MNQDLWIDGKDLAQLDNHAYQFLSGRFLPSDLNGDNVVDGADFSIGDNNWICSYDFAIESKPDKWK